MLCYCKFLRRITFISREVTCVVRETLKNVQNCTGSPYVNNQAVACPMCVYNNLSFALVNLSMSPHIDIMATTTHWSLVMESNHTKVLLIHTNGNQWGHSPNVLSFKTPPLKCCRCYISRTSPGHVAYNRQTIGPHYRGCHYNTTHWRTHTCAYIQLYVE